MFSLYTYIHAYTYIHTYIHACIYIHTYIHIYIYTHFVCGLIFSLEIKSSGYYNKLKVEFETCIDLYFFSCLF
jgi:hypothetical protein